MDQYHIYMRHYLVISNMVIKTYTVIVPHSTEPWFDIMFSQWIMSIADLQYKVHLVAFSGTSWFIAMSSNWVLDMYGQLYDIGNSTPSYPSF